MVARFIALLIIVFTVLACRQKIHKTTPVVMSETKKDTVRGNYQGIEGLWILSEISSYSKPLTTLYFSKMPFIKITAALHLIDGNTSCNSFNGKARIVADKIEIAEPLVMTQRFCAGDGESIFLSNLQRSRRFMITADTILAFYAGDTLLMKFVKSESISK